MSCQIANNETILAVIHALSVITNTYTCNEIEGDWLKQQGIREIIGKELNIVRDHTVTDTYSNDFYNALGATLIRVNDLAYCGRYSADDGMEPDPIDSYDFRYTSTGRPAIHAIEQAHQPEERRNLTPYFQSLRTLEYYSYQISEDATWDHPIRKIIGNKIGAYKEFLIETHDDYKSASWGIQAA